MIGGRLRIGSLRYLFEEYAFDTDRRELYRGAEVVSVAPQAFDLLEYLIRNREHVVSKDDLINAIWNGRIVSDAALTTRLNAARNVIGDTGEEQRLIKTLPRKGFRFIGPVREEGGKSSKVPETEPEKLALALPDKPSIAVLPFQNMSGDPEQEYFADGMVEEIITALSRNKQLFVIARNSSFTFKGKAVDIKQVARDLGVRYVLEGSVRKSGNRIRITGQLIDAASGAHLWADRYDGALEDVFELQDQVAASVVGAIAPSVTQAEMERAKRKPTSSLDAYDYYLRALAAHWQYTRDGIGSGNWSLRAGYRAGPAVCTGLRTIGGDIEHTQNLGVEHRSRSRQISSHSACAKPLYASGDKTLWYWRYQRLFWPLSAVKSNWPTVFWMKQFALIQTE